MASAELSSAEKTAASPRAPSSGGRVSMSTVGRARLWSSRSGATVRAIMPSRAGAAANTSRAAAFRPTPSLTARSSRAA